MKRLLSVLVIFAGLSTPAFIASGGSAAYDPISTACGTQGAEQSEVCANRDGKDPITGPNGALKKVSLVLASISGVVAVIMIVVAGLQYVISGGDTQKVTGARNMIVGAVVGLVVIVSAESILLFVLSKL